MRANRPAMGLSIHDFRAAGRAIRRNRRPRVGGFSCGHSSNLTVAGGHPEIADDPQWLVHGKSSGVPAYDRDVPIRRFGLSERPAAAKEHAGQSFLERLERRRQGFGNA
jgi:hypothetical protein